MAWVFGCALAPYAHAQWSACTTPGYSPRQGITIAPDGAVIAAGNDGRVWRSTDACSSWTITATDTTKSILAIAAPSATTIFTSGVQGRIYRSTNAGNTWSLLNSGTVQNLNDIIFTTALNGWVVGDQGVIRRTTNGGNTWTSVQSGTTNALHGIAFAADGSGFIVGSNGTILRTTNGVTWQPQVSGVAQALLGVTAVDASHAFACGIDSRFLRTTDGGTTWLASYLDDANYLDLHTIVAQGPDSVRAAGQGGLIRSSLDGGLTWELEAGNPGALLLDMDLNSWCEAYASGTGGVVARFSCGIPTALPGETSVHVRVGPIPFADALHVTVECPLTAVGLYDLQGVRCMAPMGDTASGITLDTRMLPSGPYILRVVCGETTAMRQVVKL